jgi:hypothetical protein
VWSGRSYFNILMKPIFLDFRKNTQISNFIKIRAVEAELFHTDGQTGMTKLTIAFRNFEKVLNKNWSIFPTAEGDFSSVANCRTKNPALFKGILGIFRGISEFIRFYSSINLDVLWKPRRGTVLQTPTTNPRIFCGNLVEGQCFRHQQQTHRYSVETS